MLERRYKLLQMDYRLILELFKWQMNPTRFLRLPCLEEELPEDVEIVSFSSDWASDSFQLMLYHPSWPIVPDGEIPPKVPMFGTKFETKEFPWVVSVDHCTEDKPLYLFAKPITYRMTSSDQLEDSQAGEGVQGVQTETSNPE